MRFAKFAGVTHDKLRRLPGAAVHVAEVPDDARRWFRRAQQCDSGGYDEGWR